MAQQPPAFQAQNNKRVAKFRKMPPAMFPPILGAFGLAAAWARTPDAFGLPAGIGQALMGAVTLLYLYVLGNYLAKLIARPSVLVDDLKVLPGRSGLATMSMAGMMLAVALMPYSQAVAKVVLVLALVMHTLVALLVIRALLTGPAEARTVSPVFHLVFVGFIVSSFAAVSLGWLTFATLIFWVMLVAAVLIWLASLAQFIRKDVPAPLRPLLAIHLAPASLLGSVALMLGMGRVGLGFGLFAILILALLLIRLRWLIAAGFSPLWGSFTFPIAAFASLMMMLGAAGYDEIFRILGGLALVGATFLIPWILVKVGQMWLKGELAAKTNSAVA
ncbi:MAG: tellurium resistance protein [Maritimibacter sp.]